MRMKLPFRLIPPKRPPIHALRPPPISARFTSTLPNPSTNLNPHHSLFNYTSGRWLWNEPAELQARYTPFNVPALQSIAAASVGANSCTAISKRAEGSYNKSLRLEMDNGAVVIARIPHPNAGPAYYTTASEVASMEFVCWDTDSKY